MSDASERAWRPGYVALARSGELQQRVDVLEEQLRCCRLRPRECGVDRTLELGVCSTGVDPVVASWNPHHGEEPPISARRGSGTVFLANCNLSCVFCQNHDISQRPDDFANRPTPAEELADSFLSLQDQGCHNLNWVSPSHQVPQLVRALAVAAGRGLCLPVVYNSNGYDAVSTLRLLDGVIDIFMPDLKYANPEAGRTCSGVPDYPERARAAITEMYRQVGDEWSVDAEGALTRGLLVRILVLPEGLAGVAASLRWIASELSPRVAVSLLAQYRPRHRVGLDPHLELLDRPIEAGEWRQAVAALHEHMRGERHHVQSVFL
jgi:putative pyruvate formate lyase activating enzyme